MSHCHKLSTRRQVKPKCAPKSRRPKKNTRHGESENFGECQLSDGGGWDSASDPMSDLELQKQESFDDEYQNRRVEEHKPNKGSRDRGKKHHRKSTRKSKRSDTRSEGDDEEDANIMHEITLNFISEQQERVIRSDDKYKLINGCAGSHKTDTLIKAAIRDLMVNKRAILFLSLTGSVTDEIKERLERYLSIKIDRVKSSKHYIGKFNGIPISIANYNAWVDCMLRHKDPDYMKKVDPSYWSAKIDYLYKYSEKDRLRCLMKDGTQVGLLIIDEVQDLQNRQMHLVVNLTKRENLDIYVAGDYLQTLYDGTGTDSLKTGHAMDIFRKIKGMSYYDLSICMRCPRAHIEFNNVIMRNIQKKYKIPPMAYNNNNMADKPVIFTHGAASTNTHRNSTAAQVVRMIDALMDMDHSIEPGDIAIIMGKSRENMLFSQIKDALDKLFTQRNMGDAVLIMDTSADGYHKNLDWNKAQGKTKMLSIPGDKGKGHKVVFFLGLTEGSIPQEAQVGKSIELLAESKLNVALTRSTKYLFIGFYNAYPSRYLANCYRQLGQYAYMVWQQQAMGANVPAIYREVIRACYRVYHANPVWAISYKTGVHTGVKSELQVRRDISKDFENSAELIPYPAENTKWLKYATRVRFGKRQRVNTQEIQDQYKVLGITSGLLLQRLHNRRQLGRSITSKLDPGTVIYTDDTQFLSCMCDLRRIPWDRYYVLQKHLLESNPRLCSRLRTAVDNKQIAVHSAFNTRDLRRNIKEFASNTKNRDLSSVCIWNVTLLHIHITSYEYDPIIPTLIDLFNSDISTLHKNIEVYYKGYVRDHSVNFEKSLRVHYDKFTPEELRDLNKDSHLVEITGRCDLYLEDTSTMIEIKTSNFDECSEEWIIQTLTYVLLMNISLNVKQMSIVNMLNGYIWTWQKLPDLPTLEDIVGNQITLKYRWHDIEKTNLVKTIQGSRAGSSPNDSVNLTEELDY